MNKEVLNAIESHMVCVVAEADEDMGADISHKERGKEAHSLGQFPWYNLKSTENTVMGVKEAVRL